MILKPEVSHQYLKNLENAEDLKFRTGCFGVADPSGELK